MNSSEDKARRTLADIIADLRVASGLEGLTSAGCDRIADDLLALSSCAPSTDRTALIFFVAWAFAEGFFEDATELKERVRAWLIKEHAGIIDDLTIEQVVESVIARKSAVDNRARL